MSRHQIGVATPLRPIQVATSKPGRDPPGGYPMSRHQFHVATSFLPTVGFPGRDTKIQVATSLYSPHRTPLSRPKNLGCDAKSSIANPARSRRPFLVATSKSCRDLKLTRPGRDLKVMSRPQIVIPRSQHEFHVTTQDPSVLTSARSRHQKGCRDTNPLQSRSRRQNDVATSPCLAQVVGVRCRCRARCCARTRPYLAHLLPSCHDLKTRS